MHTQQKKWIKSDNTAILLRKSEKRSAGSQPPARSSCLLLRRRRGRHRRAARLPLQVCQHGLRRLPSRPQRAIQGG